MLFNPAGLPGNAVSIEAQNVATARYILMRRAENSQALFGSKSEAISQLVAVAKDCSEDGWDGGDASSLTIEAVSNVATFIRLLPDDFPMPEFAPEPDGSISLDWIVSRNRIFSLSIGSGDKLAFAWLEGTDKGHAVAYFSRRSIPARVLYLIQSIVDHGKSTIRFT